MARAKNAGNGHLEEALAILIQNQASFRARVADIDARVAETDRINAERFARIEAILLEHSRILAEHSRILQTLPDMIGFKMPESREAKG